MGFFVPVVLDTLNFTLALLLVTSWARSDLRPDERH